ncbi:MAG: hypothetical protein U9O87_09230 [Verrucomicrobiota bacterium]|nr:hypothetical protein [Verrucomicrobiota bacterium]
MTQNNKKQSAYDALTQNGFTKEEADTLLTILSDKEAFKVAQNRADLKLEEMKNDDNISPNKKADAIKEISKLNNNTAEVLTKSLDKLVLIKDLINPDSNEPTLFKYEEVLSPEDKEELSSIVNSGINKEVEDTIKLLTDSVNELKEKTKAIINHSSKIENLFSNSSEAINEELKEFQKEKEQPNTTLNTTESLNT